MYFNTAVTLAASMLIASTSALPMGQKNLELRADPILRSFQRPDDASASSNIGINKRKVFDNGLKDTVLSYVQRSGGQQPMLSPSARKVLTNDNKKRSDCNDQEKRSTDPSTSNTTTTLHKTPSSTVPGAIKAASEVAADQPSVHGNATIISTNGTVTVANVTLANNGTIVKTSAPKNSTDGALVLLNNGTLAQNVTQTGKSRVSAGTRDTLSVGYWAEWTADTLSPENIPWSKYDVMNYAFAIPNSDATITLNDASLLKRMVAAAHANGKKMVLSIGGAGQSGGFIGATGDATSISKFIANLVALQKKYNLDGFDFDWEYPNNLISSRRRKRQATSDVTQFQTFLQTLRPQLPQGMILAAAVPTEVWQTSSGAKVASVARAASALDYIFIMGYDVWGTYNPPGPNSPLANLCGNTTQPSASAAGSVKAWTNAGMPRNKIVMGLPMYGYLVSTSKTTLIQRGESMPHKRAVAKLTDMGGGQINFKSIISQGALKNSGGIFVPGTGYTKYWDGCSDTPYLSSGSQIVIYDDPASLQDKAQFAYLAGLRGAGVWSIDGDTSNLDLINAIRTGLRKS